MSVVRRVAHGLGLDRLGYRSTWTVRLAHAVHLVALRESPLGEDVLVDGAMVTRADPWDFTRPVRFRIGDAPAEVRFVTDTDAGTLRTDLFVGGDLIAPDEAHAVPVRRAFWGPRLERAAYASAGALVLAGLAGDPIFSAVRQIVRTIALLVLLAGLQAFDPFGVLAVGVDKVVEDQPSMLIAATEIAVIAMIAADRFRLRQRVPFIREHRRLPRILGWTAITVVAFAILSLT
jgi:hypothetical protein